MAPADNNGASRHYLPGDARWPYGYERLHDGRLIRRPRGEAFTAPRVLAKATVSLDDEQVEMLLLICGYKLSRRLGAANLRLAATCYLAAFCSRKGLEFRDVDEMLKSFQDRSNEKLRATRKQRKSRAKVPEEAAAPIPEPKVEKVKPEPKVVGVNPETWMPPGENW